VALYRLFTGRATVPHWAGVRSQLVAAVAFDLRRTAGYLVADRHGKVVGRVECPMYGTAPDVPDALSVRIRRGLFARRKIVPADAIAALDVETGVIGLSVDREQIPRFL
jgi:hypothetical protein